VGDLELCRGGSICLVTAWTVMPTGCDGCNSSSNITAAHVF
jgi:hypothetical protein